MRATISQRAKAQERQRELWGIIKRTESNRSKEMEAITKQIGDATHKLNYLITQLCQYKRTHKAMNLAYQYIKKEIDRIDGIIRGKERAIYLVSIGQKCWITDEGVSHTDSTNMRKYVELKRNQRNKLQNWLNYVSRYLVK